MTDKDDLIMSIDELGKARKEKTAKLRAAVKTVSANRQTARESQTRPG